MNTRIVGTALFGLALYAGVAYAEDMATGRTPFAEQKWSETGFGPWASPVSGDLSKGPHVTLIKFAPGMKTPVHVHTNSYTAVVVSGNWKHFEPGKPETETVLTAGAKWFVNGGAEHISECVGPEDCISVVYQDKTFDYLPKK
jgi:quercetin dioxygenase-like cupin family protein